jgi:hypothetical protein
MAASVPVACNDNTFRRRRIALPRSAHNYADCRHHALPGDDPANDIPDCKTKNKPVTKDEAAGRYAFGRFRVRDEDTITSLNPFEMLSKRYRYPRPAGVATFAIIAGVVILAASF